MTRRPKVTGMSMRKVPDGSARAPDASCCSSSSSASTR
jgi:hypothetical protein